MSKNPPLNKRKEALTSKRNRGVAIIKWDKLLKSVLTGELPSSRQVRLYLLNGPAGIGKPRQKI